MKGGANMYLGIGLGLIVVLGAWLLVWPAYRTSRTLEDQISVKRVKLSQPSDGPELIASLGERLGELKALGRERMVPIPEQADIAGLIGSVTSAFDGIGLGEREITMGVSRELDEARTMPMSITVSGPFLTVYEAVRVIEAMPRLLRVQRVQVSRGTQRTRSVAEALKGESVVRADLLIDVFFEPRHVESGSGEGGG